jgi:TolA-binding protein
MMMVDPAGTKRHEFEGYLPPEEFLAQLELGLAKSAFARELWTEAEQRFRKIVDQYPKTAAAEEALYWAGVAKYKASGDAGALKETAQEFAQRYPQSVWAKKALPWAA